MIYDKNGSEIKEGCNLVMHFLTVYKEQGTDEWVTFNVRLSGACLIAERTSTSDYTRIKHGYSVEHETMCPIDARAVAHYLDGSFDYSRVEVM